MANETRFIIFSCGYNCGEYVYNNLTTIINQNYDNFAHIIVDDASTDSTPTELKKNKNRKTTIYTNDKNQKWIPNALQYLDKHIESDEDVIITIDLDDWLAHTNVLSDLNDVYQQQTTWMTYSDFQYLRSGKLSNWIPRIDRDWILARNSFREEIWGYTHLRTMKAFLWNNIDKNDLKDKNGDYFKYTYDQAIFLPALEMSRKNHIRYIPDVQYIYNDVNPGQVEKIHGKEQRDNAKYIRSKKKYEMLVRPIYE